MFKQDFSQAIENNHQGRQHLYGLRTTHYSPRDVMWPTKKDRGGPIWGWEIRSRSPVERVILVY